MSKIVWVDLPMVEKDSDTGKAIGKWEFVTEIRGEEAKEKAVEWLRRLFGQEAVDDEGRVCLLTKGEEGEDRDEEEDCGFVMDDFGDFGDSG